MKETKPERVYYDKHGIRISRDEMNWKVATIQKRGDKSREPGSEAVANITYHGSLASACCEAAHRVADAGERGTLREYAELLKMAVAELRTVPNAGP